MRKLLLLARSSGLSAWDNEPISLTQPTETKIDVDRGVSNPSEVDWIVFDGLRLSQFDKEVLYDGKQLNDNHISFAQGLLKYQFPCLNGLKSSLLQRKQQRKIQYGVQIIHSRGNHWIVASSLGCSDNQVNVFDSLYTSVDDDTKSVVFNLFEFEGEPKLNVINI